jgi:DNA helicase II / ATP-dependent DNA helicase PcrA
MITLDVFYQAYQTFRPLPDAQQKEAIEAAPGQPLFIVAGPGTGKTTCLTLRILKLVLVDGLAPRSILATTFTKKAAQELRSRVLGWGFRMLDALRGDPGLAFAEQAFLSGIDVNQVWTGTVDSLCDQVLRDHRAPGAQPPVLIDDYVAKTLLMREGLLVERRDQDPDLSALLLQLHSETGSTWGFHAGRKNELLHNIWDRRFQDQVDWDAFVHGGVGSEAPARATIGQAIGDYEQALAERGMVDFALLENEVLQRLRNGQLDDFAKELRVVLVDEYQDTNLLQEQLYFELVSVSGGALGVVGDDDQSLYRFRGATVALFRDFAQRFCDRFDHTPKPVFLSNNYRSTHAVVDIVNAYAILDEAFQEVRVAQKPGLAAGPNAVQGSPVLGMFRDTIEQLATDLAGLIHSVFRGPGVLLPNGAVLVRDPHGGDVGDCALLCSSPAELATNNRPRLPLLLRQELGGVDPPIPIFNPRGEDLTGIPLIQRFGGLLLECLDPGGVLEVQTKGIPPDALQTFQQWRTAALAFTEDPAVPAGLVPYAVGWADRDPGRQDLVWSKSVAAIDLIYGLTHYFPELHDDAEGQVYLEIFARQLAACAQIGKFKGRVVREPDNQGLNDASVRELLRDFLAPIASGAIQVDEELMEAFPRDRLSILSIHQSKGLEFPLTIVDVGADFKDLRAPKFKRHPVSGGPPHRMEDLLRPHSALGVPSRDQVDRAFDDLYRQFFVAFSRAQDVLLLVGVRPTLPGGRVPNIATGWDRTSTCHWASGKKPFVLI